MKCRISVIMPVYNESLRELTDSINAILHQSLKPFEFIIIDDNPKSEKIKKFLLHYNNNDIIKLVFNKKNIGAGRSRNVGIENSSGNFIAFTDADDLSDSDRLEKQYRFLKNNNLDFVFSNSRESNENGRITKKEYYISKSIVNQKKIRYVLTHCSNMANQSTWLLDRKVISKIHGYRNLIVEDFDFVLRALISQCKLGYQSKVLITRVIRHNSITKTNYFKQYLVARIIRQYFNKEKSIMPKSLIKRSLLFYSSKKEKKYFREFLNYGHKLKLNFNLVNIYYFLKSIYKSKVAYKYLLDLVIGRANMIFMRISTCKQ